ncbi:duboraya [Paramormyrops kingsleyae]|uniref:Duboraya n=1 Tax=Paramormyrops kingsleyae TaxID=1676925 RepID=A0A3B3T1C5_9TELE|nr:capZ-interacting protein-like [Paramormyrops kingsleyae]
MEKSTFAQHSVSKLAEKFKVQNLQTSDRTEVSKNIRRKPPCSLKLQMKNDEEQDKQEKQAAASSQPPKVKSTSSPLIEKLQANLVLSPTALLPSPMSPGVKHPAPFFTPPCGPLSPPPQPHQRRPSEEEVPASFEKPAEGNILPSINKSRARHSIKRRPPTRLPRMSSGEEPSGTEEAGPTSTATSGSLHDGDEEDVFQESDSATKKEQQENTPSALPDGRSELEKEESLIKDNKVETDSTCGCKAAEDVTEPIKPDGETPPDSTSSGETPPEPQVSDSASSGETPPDSTSSGETPPEPQMSDSAPEAPKIQEECKEVQPETAGETDDSTGVKKGAPLQEKEDADEGIGM